MERDAKEREEEQRKREREGGGEESVYCSGASPVGTHITEIKAKCKRYTRRCTII